MSKFPSKIVRATYTAPTASTAVGVFAVTQQLQASQSGTWPLPVYNIDYLVVAGGAAGGSGGGGGAGGLLTSSSVTINIGSVYTVTVGAGGASAANGNN